MPRRTKDADMSTDTEAAVAASTDEVAAAGGSSEPTNGNEAPKRSGVDDLPLGPTQTRTGAAATVIQGPKGKRVFTAGGDKGAKIAELLKTKPEMPRKEIAALVGCSQSRVAEVARVLGLASARPPSPSAEGSDAAPEPETPPTTEPAPAEATSVST